MSPVTSLADFDLDIEPSLERINQSVNHLFANMVLNVRNIGP